MARDGAMARWRDGGMARWRDGLLQCLSALIAPTQGAPTGVVTHGQRSRCNAGFFAQSNAFRKASQTVSRTSTRAVFLSLAPISVQGA